VNPKQHLEVNCEWKGNSFANRKKLIGKSSGVIWSRVEADWKGTRSMERNSLEPSYANQRQVIHEASGVLWTHDTKEQIGGNSIDGKELGLNGTESKGTDEWELMNGLVVDERIF